MSLIQITDLHHIVSEFVILTQRELEIINGGRMASGFSLSSNGQQVMVIEPYNSAYSFSLANTNKVRYFGASSGANFDATFTIDGQNSKQVVNSAVGYITQSSGSYIQASH